MVDTWIRTKDLESEEAVQQQILDTYQLDFIKHAPPKDFPKLAAVWRSIPIRLSNEYKVQSKNFCKNIHEERCQWRSQGDSFVSSLANQKIPDR